MTGQELKKWRQEQGLTQTQLAGHLGVIKTTVARWETGTRSIPSFLPLALQALATNLTKGVDHGNRQKEDQ